MYSEAYLNSRKLAFSEGRNRLNTASDTKPERQVPSAAESSAPLTASDFGNTCYTS